MPAAAPLSDAPLSDAPLPDATRKRTPGLLATKLHAPTPRADLVLRPRLLNLLDAGRSARLILLSAPAGSGKTTLLAAWLRQALPHSRRAGWLALDAADNDPARFLAYLVAAAAAALPDDMAGEAGELQSRLRAAEPPAAEAVLTDLINLIAPLPGDLILALDDYHVIAAPAVHGAVASLLEHLPPNLHLVVATRADPPLPLARLRSRGQLAELRAGDLRFTPEEAAAFLNGTMGLALSPQQAAALDERTEGWIAGLQLAALSMAGRDDVEGFIRAFTGSNRFILDFLMEEVLGREPETVQQFLLHTAVLNPFCAALCDAVTGRTDSGQMIDRLERRNLFVVPLDDGRCWYRYHHLFADLLQARLRQLEPARAAQLQARAASWCEQAGQTAEAIGYALAAKEYTRAGDLIAACWGPLSNTGRIETAWGWLAALPPAIVAASAPLSIACCWMLWLRGQPELMGPHLIDAERALNGPSGRAPADLAAADAPLWAQAATLRAFVARYAGEFAAAIAQAERARELVNEELGPEVDAQLHAQLRALAALALASACDGAGDLPRAADAYAESVRWSQEGRNAAGVAVTYRLAGVLRLLGRLDEAEEVCRAALRFLEEQQMARLPPAGVLHLALAEVLLERDDLAAAEDHLARGSELGRRSGRLDAVRNAAAVLVRLRLRCGDVAGALAAVDAALVESQSPLAQAELLSLRAKVLIREGSLPAAAACVAEAERLAVRECGLTRETVTLDAARLWLAQSEGSAAVKHLAQFAEAIAAAEDRGWFGAVIELRIVRGLLRARLGDVRAAEADVQAALALAEPRGYMRLFLDEGLPLAELLRGLAARRRTRPRDGALAALLGAFAAAGDLAANSQSAQGAPRADWARAVWPRAGADGAAAQPLIEALSERELEVLRLLAAGLTNEQIAHRLVIALGTVKAHIHHIAGKLGAQNRAHAVARAQELGLL